MKPKKKEMQNRISKFEQKRVLTGILFLLPNALLCSIFIAIPLIVTFIFSFTDWNGIDGSEVKFVGLWNYININQIPGLRESVIATLFYVVAVTILIVVISLAVALMLDKREKGRLNRTFMRALWFFPGLLSTVVVGLIWRMVFHYHNGMINKTLISLGGEPVNWLETVGLSNICTVIATVWTMMGMTIVIFLAGLQSIPTELYEAAKIDGASQAQIRRSITIPMLAPSLTINFLTTSIAAFKSYELPWLVSMGLPGFSSRLWTKTIYFYGFEQIGRLGLGFALSVVLCIVITAISVVQLVVLRKRENIY